MAFDPDTGAPCDLPDEFLNYILVTKVYRCMPGDLVIQDRETVLLDFEFWNAEQSALKRLREKNA